MRKQNLPLIQIILSNFSFKIPQTKNREGKIKKSEFAQMTNFGSETNKTHAILDLTLNKYFNNWGILTIGTFCWAQFLQQNFIFTRRSKKGLLEVLTTPTHILNTLIFNSVRRFIRVEQGAKCRYPRTFFRRRNSSIQSGFILTNPLANLSVWHFYQVTMDIGLFELWEEQTSGNYQQFADYFEDTYVGSWRVGRQIRQNFEADEWNIYARVISKQAGTKTLSKDRMAALTSLWQTSTNPFRSPFKRLMKEKNT